jgi:hypothetical protein
MNLKLHPRNRTIFLALAGAVFVLAVMLAVVTPALAVAPKVPAPTETPVGYVEPPFDDITWTPTPGTSPSAKTGSGICPFSTAALPLGVAAFALLRKKPN